jgi:uncharacterized protein (DUF1501 family)
MADSQWLQSLQSPVTRRGALLGLAGAVTFGRASLALAPAPTDRRFVVVILRGALDGMAAVAPYGDRDLAGWRGKLAPPPPGQPDGLLDLGGFFGLHPALPGLHAMYAGGELLVVHAVAGSDRSRSHFIAQDSLELGGHYGITSGWLNRAAGLVPSHARAEPALAVGPEVPLLLRGPTRVGSWMPQGPQHGTPDFYAALSALHEHDPLTGPVIATALRERGFTAETLAGSQVPPDKMAFPALCVSAGRLLAAPDGPRFAALELGGWDTHAGQVKRMPHVFKPLDDGLVALKAGLGDAWRQTAVLVVTEFGRTVRMNGSFGTDHGTGTVAFLLGGRIAGGRVAGDWPGLAQDRLFENRDLQPTTDVRSVAKGLLAQHVGLDAAALAKVFPDAQMASPMRGLLRS